MTIALGARLISCRKLLAELSNYLDDELDPDLRRELQVHLRACPDCWVLFDTTRRTIIILRGNEPYPMPEDVKQRLTEAIHRKMARFRPQA
mgnify:CR=1 FL=1